MSTRWSRAGGPGAQPLVNSGSTPRILSPGLNSRLNSRTDLSRLSNSNSIVVRPGSRRRRAGGVPSRSVSPDSVLRARAYRGPGGRLGSSSVLMSLRVSRRKHVNDETSHDSSRAGWLSSRRNSHVDTVAARPTRDDYLEAMIKMMTTEPQKQADLPPCSRAIATRDGTAVVAAAEGV